MFDDVTETSRNRLQNNRTSRLIRQLDLGSLAPTTCRSFDKFCSGNDSFWKLRGRVVGNFSSSVEAVDRFCGKHQLPCFRRPGK